jgi:hypothetical protein
MKGLRAPYKEIVESSCEGSRGAKALRVRKSLPCWKLFHFL